MRKILIATLLLSCGSATLGAKSANETGFECKASDGQVKRFNIDLKRKRYDAGDGVSALYAITETKITLEGPNRYMADDPDPYFHSLVLDRKSLILTDEVLMPSQNIKRVIAYQCTMVTLIDFAQGRQF